MRMSGRLLVWSPRRSIPLSSLLLLVRPTGSPKRNVLIWLHRTRVRCSIISPANGLPVKGTRLPPSRFSASPMSSSRLGGDFPRVVDFLLPLLPRGPMEGESGTRRPSSVVTSGQNDIDRPRRCRLAASASTSACLCSARPAENARQETPPPPCNFALSTRCTSCVFFFGGEVPASGGVVLTVVVLSVLPFRELTASSSLSESLSCRYF